MTLDDLKKYPLDFEQTCLDDPENLYYFASKGRGYIFEIGTAQGISALFFALIGLNVYTFDVTEKPIKHEIWKDFGVQDKIRSYIIQDKNELLYHAEHKLFDIAFIDALKLYEDNMMYFEAVKKCGKVIIHDVDGRYGDMARFARDIGCKEYRRYFAWWEGRPTS